MPKTKYYRNGHTIYGAKEDGSINKDDVVFDGMVTSKIGGYRMISINAAKRKSAELQRKNGGIGRGSLVNLS